MRAPQPAGRALEPGERALEPGERVLESDGRVSVPDGWAGRALKASGPSQVASGLPAGFRGPLN